MANIGWSTPERRRGNKILTLIPNEIYLDIFDRVDISEENTHTERKQILSNLALVCHFFCTIALPRVFKSVDFPGFPEGDDGPEKIGGMGLCRALVNGSKTALSLVPYVKECTVRNRTWSPQRSDRLRSSFLALYFKAIKRLVGIESLTLKGVPLTSLLFEALRGLKQLTSLSLVECVSERDSTEVDMVRDLPDLCLTTIRCNSVCMLDGQFQALAKALRSPSLRVLDSSDRPFLLAMLESPGEFPLEQLTMSLNYDDAGTLQNFLEQTPSLAKLCINDFIFEGRDLPTLPMFASTLPNIQHLGCAISLLPNFAPGRSLRSVDIVRFVIRDHRSFVEKQNLSLLLDQSRHTITTLNLFSSHWEPHLGSHFLALCNLSVVFDLAGRTLPIDAIQVLFSSSDPCHSVRHLCIRFLKMPYGNIDWDLEVQHSSIEALSSSAFPNATRISIVDHVEWQRDNGSHWQAFIPGTLRVYVRSHLRKACCDVWPKVKDFGGCFAALFTSAELDSEVRALRPPRKLRSRPGH